MPGTTKALERWIRCFRHEFVLDRAASRAEDRDLRTLLHPFAHCRLMTEARAVRTRKCFCLSRTRPIRPEFRLAQAQTSRQTGPAKFCLFAWCMRRGDTEHREGVAWFAREAGQFLPPSMEF